MADPPPPPPPHGHSPRPPGGLPDGNYDIFIIPPHSSGSGFLYLPSLAVQRNSFLAGVACTLVAVGLYTLVVPALKQWMATIMASGGAGIFLLLVGVGVAGWAWGKTQLESGRNERNGGGGGANQRQSQNAGAPPPKANGWAPPPQPEQPPPQPEPPKPEAKPKPKPAAASGWEKAREETRKREEARKKEEEIKKKAEELQKAREEAERAAKAKAEKEKWEQARAREKEQREREARERIARERLAREKEAREKDTREREAREKAASAAKSRTSPSKPTSSRYEKPTARSFVGTEEEYSYRPYDSAPPPRRPGYKSSASSVSGLSESSFAPSQTTARTTPPPSQRGKYNTTDPDKIMLVAVYLFSDSFPTKPIASLVSSQGPVTDGLILHIKTEGLFIDDDVRGVPQREWDVKAWTLKLVEDGVAKNNSGEGMHVLRATTRDAENKKYCFVIKETEAWKVALGLQRLRKGSQVRALHMSGLKEGEVRGLLGSLGWL